MTTQPHGTWPSPIAPADLTAGQARIDEVRVDGAATYWLESRPWEKGRTALVRHDGTERSDVLPEPWNVRSRVHEYGGGSYAVRDGLVVVSEFTDGRLRRIDPGSSEPVAFTPELAVRYGGLVLHGDHVYAVREDHRGGGEPVNELVRLDLHGDNADGGVVLAAGSDFVSRPAVAPDGTAIAWIAWDHPNMPWDSTRLLVADLGAQGASRPRVVAGGDGIAVSQPQFGPDGSLWFISDESNWWTLHRHDASGTVAVHEHEADFAQPQWVLGMVDYALLPEGRVLMRRWVGAGSRLGVLDPRDGRLVDVDDEGVMFEHLVSASDGEVAFRRGLADRLPEVVRGPLTGAKRVLASSAPTTPDPAFVSRAEARSWTNGAGLTTHGLLYRPHNPDVSAPEGELPPLLVFVHGGPTSRTEPAYTSLVQFWTTRGFAVLDVNHGGSTGYGRAFRERLNGQWGIVDIDDCVSGVQALADAGVIDGGRVAIRGGSAGGYTTLRALTSSTVFAAGTSLYGISDLRALLADDHKFESRYTTTLVAPWPEGEEVYLERSPLFHIDALHGELLLLQGADDLVVPVVQAQAMADAMAEAGKDVELVIYEGEGHGFRRAETVIDALERELAHYQRVFGLSST
jgi:dipeptidyl aminopeptidase/acylaminoacyl peptidase